MHAKAEWHSLIYFLSLPWFSGCVQSSVYFFFLFCTPTDYIMLMGLFKWRRHAALLTDGRSAYKAKVVSGRWGEKILKLVSDVKQLQGSTTSLLRCQLFLLSYYTFWKPTFKSLEILRFWPKAKIMILDLFFFNLANVYVAFTVCHKISKSL